MGRKHCCCGACKVCTTVTSSAAAFQATPSGFAGSGGPCTCTDYNATLALGAYLFDGALPGYITNELVGGRNCQYTAINYCGANPLYGIYVLVILYQNNTGGVSAYAYMDVADGSTLIYEGTALVASGATQVNCATLDVTVTLTQTSGTTPANCGSPTDIRIEGI